MSSVLKTFSPRKCRCFWMENINYKALKFVDVSQAVGNFQCKLKGRVRKDKTPPFLLISSIPNSAVLLKLLCWTHCCFQEPKWLPNVLWLQLSICDTIWTRNRPKTHTQNVCSCLPSFWMILCPGLQLISTFYIVIYLGVFSKAKNAANNHYHQMG